MSRLNDLRSSGSYDRWSARVDRPLLALSALFLVVFLVPLFAPNLPSPVRTALFVGNVLIWMAFAIDYVVRLALAPHRPTFVRRHVPDLLVLAVPILRPLRLLRVVGMLGAATRRAEKNVQSRTTVGVVAAVAVLVVLSAGLVLDAERGHEQANIADASDALWWAATTVTTVGYGDRYPTTGEGRMVGVLLMLGGIALLGVLTASVAAWFVKRFTAVEEIEQTVQNEAAESARVLAEINQRLSRLEVVLQELRPLRPADQEAAASQ